jgi:hypothetical protein
MTRVDSSDLNWDRHSPETKRAANLVVREIQTRQMTGAQFEAFLQERIWPQFPTYRISHCDRWNCDAAKAAARSGRVAVLEKLEELHQKAGSNKTSSSLWLDAFLEGNGDVVEAVLQKRQTNKNLRTLLQQSTFVDYAFGNAVKNGHFAGAARLLKLHPSIPPILTTYPAFHQACRMIEESRAVAPLGNIPALQRVSAELLKLVNGYAPQ